MSAETPEKYMRNEHLEKLEHLVDLDGDESINVLETLPLAHNHIMRVFDEAMHVTTVEEHRRLMTEGSLQWLRYDMLLFELKEEGE